MVSPPVSPSLTRTPTATDSTGNLTHTSTSATWTPDQEVRLAYCQDQLKQAQKKWSDRQELWIREVDYLLEQKRLHLKSLKSRPKDLRLWKTRSWKAPVLSRTQSAVAAYGRDNNGDGGGGGGGGDQVGVGVGVEEKDDGEQEGERLEGEEKQEGEREAVEEGEVVGLRRVGRSESMPVAVGVSTLSSPPFPPPPKATTSPATFSSPSISAPTAPASASTSLTSARGGKNPFKKMIRRISMSGAKGAGEGAAGGSFRV